MIKCLTCDREYDKKNFHICPFCGGDGGGILPKVWKPVKKDKIKYAKKMAGINNSTNGINQNTYSYQ